VTAPRHPRKKIMEKLLRESFSVRLTRTRRHEAIGCKFPDHIADLLRERGESNPWNAGVVFSWCVCAEFLGIGSNTTSSGSLLRHIGGRLKPQVSRCGCGLER